MPNPPKWYAPLIKAVRAAAFFVAHALLATLVIGLISAVRWVLRYLGEPMLFGWIPLGYIFDAMDAATLLVFIPFAIIEAVRVFREKSDG
jgi:hypothetical protein